MILRSAFPFLVTGWAVLWAALCMTEGGFNQGVQEIALLLVIPAVGWLFGWLRANAMAPVSADTRWDLARTVLGIAPILLIGNIPAMREHMRHLAPGDVHKDIAPQILKAASFCLPWLLLFATRAPGHAPIADERPAAPASCPAIPPRPPSPSVLIPIGDTLRALPWTQVLWLEADDNHVRLHTAGGDYFVRRSLRDLLTDAGARFARIHKSRAVNLAEIAAIKPLTNGDGEIHLRTGKKLRMSRRFRQELAALLKT